jgi:hypothetical protein
MPPETWLPIPLFPNYDASSLGRIRNRLRNRIIKARRSHTGYMVVNLRRSGKSFSCYVHRLVCSAFHGPHTPARPLVGHGDGSKLNNRPENLRWVSASENQLDNYRHGKIGRGHRHPNARLSSRDIDDILSLTATHSYADIARLYKVSAQHISRIARGVSRAHRHGECIADAHPGPNNPQP